MTLSPTPAPPTAVMAALVARTPLGATVLVGTSAVAQREPGSACPVLVLEFRGDRPPIERWDGLVAAEDLEPLRKRLNELFRVWPGELDDAGPGRWSVGWSIPPAPFRLVGRKGLRCSLDGGRLLVGRRRLRARDVAAVRTVFFPGRSAVFVDFEGARTAEICQRKNPAGERARAPGDDSGWATALARTLAGAVGVTFEPSDQPDG